MRTNGQRARPSRIFVVIERRLLSLAMTMVAVVVERRLIRVIKRSG